MKTRLVATAAMTLALLAANVAHAGDSHDKAPDYTVPGIGAIIAWLFGR